jgi:hypothetical protein
MYTTAAFASPAYELYFTAHKQAKQKSIRSGDGLIQKNNLVSNFLIEKKRSTSPLTMHHAFRMNARIGTDPSVK